MKTKNIFILAINAIALVACSQDRELSYENSPNTPKAIQIRSNLADLAMTRTFGDASDQTQSETILSGQYVYAWVEDYDAGAATPSSSPYINGWLLSANGSNGFTGTTFYYPSTGHNVDVYCLHGNITGFTTDKTAPAEAVKGTTALASNYPSSIVHTVMADQSSAANYAKSDLLIGGVKNVKDLSAAVEVKMVHKLSKIEVFLKIDDNVTVTGNQLRDANTKIYILNDNTTATIASLSKPAAPDFTSATSVDDKSAVIASYGGTVAASATTSVTQIQMYKTKTDASADAAATLPVFAEAIFVPQTVAANTPFIKVALADGGTLTAKIAETEFKPGLKYVYTVTVKRTGLQLSSSIYDWESGATATPDATMD